ncbi:MAG TPA: lamin tail domain-containing protein, partial [Verrucomicrobiae bacterium]
MYSQHLGRNLPKFLLAFFISSLACGYGRAADNVFISEFMAVNNRTLPDEDGDFSDWIEIHNGGTNTVNLGGWYLTDKISQLTEWQFPATNLAPNGYLIVFASGKDRRVAGAPLHTNFKLGSDGEYLALVQPDGTTIASAFSPKFPAQVADVSYGLALVPTVTSLIASGVTARVLIPGDDSLSTAWTTPGFNDAGWLTAQTGIGFDYDDSTPFVPATIANSVLDFSGTQGQDNWYYGYWNKKNDADGKYSDSEFVAFPNLGGGFGANNFWNGSIWDWFNGDPPYIQLGSQGGRPSGDNGNGALPVHWAIRRYICETNGPVTITGNITHTSDWVYVTQSGFAANSILYIYQLGPGEGFIDDIKLVQGLVPESGVNVLQNGDFESGSIAPWVPGGVGNLSQSFVTSAVKHGGNFSLHIVSTASGTSASSAIAVTNSPALISGQPYTLSYWYLPVTNSSQLVVRTSGSWIGTTPAYCGDGTIGRIFVDGTEVFTQRAFVNSTDYSITVAAQTGSRIDFVLDPGLTNNDLCDNTSFTAAVKTTDPTVAIVADSVADWSVTGLQGYKNWYYGFWNGGTGFPLPSYSAGAFTPFPNAGGPPGTNNFWDGQSWHAPFGSTPIDEIGQYAMIPNGNNDGAIHWAIRRWVSTVNGTITLNYRIEKPETTGGGATVRIFRNGSQIDAANVPASLASVLNRKIDLVGVQVGDLIDFALDPSASGDFNDTGDECLVSVTIQGHPSLTSQVAGNIGAAMHNVNASAYIRIPFNVSDPSVVQFLTLRMKYDDGFIAYLNGTQVATVNAPALPTWNSAATTSRSDADAVNYQDFDITGLRGLLQFGQNVLAIQGLNASAGDSDFLILPELRATSVNFDPNAYRYFISATPGAANGPGSTNLGPIIASASHAPKVPLSNQDLTVTAQVGASQRPVSSVTLVYRVMYSNEVSVPMFDDGFHNDGAAGDGIYGATIPHGVAQPGRMIRYYIFARDSANVGSRLPTFEQVLDSPQYLGTVVSDPS